MTKYSSCLQIAKPDIEECYQRCKQLTEAKLFALAGCQLACIIGVYSKLRGNEQGVQKCALLLKDCETHLLANHSQDVHSPTFGEGP